MKTTTNKGKIAILLLLYTSFKITGLQAQNPIIDSLKTVLITAKEDTNKVTTLNHLSRFLIGASKLDSAMLCAKSALELSQKLNYKSGMGYAYNRIGSVYEAKGNSPEALINYQSALKIKEALGEKRGLAWTYCYIGGLYHGQGNENESLKYYLRGKEIMKEVNDVEGEIICYNGIGNSYGSIGNYSEALDNYFIVLQMSQENNVTYCISLAYNNIGDIYLKQRKYKECLETQFSALKIAEKDKDRYSVLLSFLNISIAYKNIKEFNKAEQFGLKSLKLSNEISEMRLKRDAQKTLSEIYTDMGDNKKAFEFYKYYIATRDSFINQENTKKTTELEMNYQFDKKEAIAKLEQEKKDAIQETKLYGAVFGVILSLIVMIVIFRGYKRKQKDNILLTKQKEELNEKNRIIEEKQKETLASIRYAKHIQISLMPTEKYIEKTLNRLKQ